MKVYRIKLRNGKYTYICKGVIGSVHVSEYGHTFMYAIHKAFEYINNLR